MLINPKAKQKLITDILQQIVSIEVFMAEKTNWQRLVAARFTHINARLFAYLNCSKK